MKDKKLSQMLGVPDIAEVPYDSLMPRRVSNLLLVSSLYDYYTIIEDGKLSEMLYNEYLQLDLRFTPSIERVSRAEDALELLQREPFDLVISMPRVGEMNILQFSDAIHKISPSLPVVLMTSSARELKSLPPIEELKGIDSAFIWQGDVRLFLAIIKYTEDRYNAPHDTRAAGVKCIILIEDSVQFYSSYLPMLYTEILHQTRALTEDSIGRAQKVMRLRARPKVLLAKNYEEGARLIELYEKNLLGVIIDAAFPQKGRLDRCAGFQIARLLKDRLPEIPVLMQSDSQNAAAAQELGLAFLDKRSPTLMAGLRDFMQKNLGFGDFTFVGPDNSVLARVPNLRALEWALQAISHEAILPNVSRNEFFVWLMARTEFNLAEAIKNVIQDYGDKPSALKDRLLQTIRTFRKRSMSGLVVDYSTKTFESNIGFVRIGDGSLGGKGRGLAFLNSLIKDYNLETRFDNVRITVPPTAVLTTGVFDDFMESSGLRAYALTETDDRKITEAFLAHEFPRDVLENLWNFLQWIRYPLAVRSSSLLEDALYQPFAGIYNTFMIPNLHDDPEIRLQKLGNAIKMVYASTYHSDPKAYMKSLPNRLEEEKMAVVIQQIVGRQYDHYFYPNIGGVARSLNFYPAADMVPEDGIVSVALGMGKTVVEGGRCYRFCPAYPKKPIQSFTPEEYLDNSQRNFLALDLTAASLLPEQSYKLPDLVSLDLVAAENHGTLAPVASTYSQDNNAIYDGISRNGARLVTMAGLLKGNIMPLADITAFLLKVCTAASSCPVEMEFAVNLSDNPREPHHFACLQVRPLVVGSESYEININAEDKSAAVCISHMALGNGIIADISDIIYVRMDTFNRSKTQLIADEIGAITFKLRERKRPFILMGPGRWGSADPWLGIPVKWAQISGVRCMVETDFEDMHVDPSQGSHFFQNIISFGIGYLTVGTNKNDFLDVSWINQSPAEYQSEHIRHISLAGPVQVALNGKKNLGVISKPTISAGN